MGPCSRPSWLGTSRYSPANVPWAVSAWSKQNIYCIYIIFGICDKTSISRIVWYICASHTKVYPILHFSPRFSIGGQPKHRIAAACSLETPSDRVMALKGSERDWNAMPFENWKRFWNAPRKLWLVHDHNIVFDIEFIHPVRNQNRYQPPTTTHGINGLLNITNFVFVLLPFWTFGCTIYDWISTSPTAREGSTMSYRRICIAFIFKKVWGMIKFMIEICKLQVKIIE